MQTDYYPDTNMTGPNNKSSSPASVTRRTALKTGLAGAISLTCAGQVVGHTHDDTVTITTVKAGNTPRVRKQVPADWWEFEMRSEEVQDQLRRQFGLVGSKSAVPGIDGVGIGTLDETISGRQISYLKVYVDSNESPEVTIPSEVDGVSVEIVETPQVEGDSCNKSDFDPMPGGVMVGTSSGDYAGTATCQVSRTDSQGNKNYYMLTAAHLFTCNNEDISGDLLYQNTQRVGNVEDYNLAEDWVLVPRGQDTEISDFSNEIEDTTGILAGHVSKAGLRDLKSNGTTVYKQGVETCKTSGQVEDIDATITNCNGKTHDSYVKTTTRTVNGDSGSPHYHQYTYNGCYYLAIIAPHYGGESYGCGAYHLNSTRGIHFDPEFTFGYCR